MKYIILFLLFPFLARSQPNCAIYPDSTCRKACELSIDAEELQWYRAGQEMFDTALEICPSMAYAWRQKAEPYLKSGDFITWKTLIDKAVQNDTIQNLGYRGWCRFHFFRDYKGAIANIEALEKKVKNVGYSSNGEYSLTIVKGMCYGALGKNELAAEIIKKRIESVDYDIIGIYDYYQLGNIYFAMHDLTNALKCFDEQSRKNEFAENLYMKSKVYFLRNDINMFMSLKSKALDMYKEDRHLQDYYAHHLNKIYYETMESNSLKLE